MFAGEATIPGKVNTFETSLADFTTECFTNIAHDVVIELFFDNAANIVCAENMIGEAGFLRRKIKGFTVIGRGWFANFRALRLFINFGQIVTGTGFRCGFNAGGFQAGFSTAKTIKYLFTGKADIVGKIVEQLQTETRVFPNFFFEKTLKELLKMSMVFLQNTFLDKQ